MKLIWLEKLKRTVEIPFMKLIQLETRKRTVKIPYNVLSKP
ncbi:hypothetical protein M2444_002179 [Paenibacillus sp. PastF-3]|nr:hypothetical protein [Paenibacillus sp. PastF-3]MDH6370399.1 hypothetical protein [Paenibacillus sp. PastF-3]